MTTPSPDEARQALAEIDAVTRQMRRAIHQGLTARILLLWGVLWTLIFTLGVLFPRAGDRIAWPLNLLGFLVTGLLVARQDRQVRGECTRGLLKQLSFAWIAIIGFAILLPILLQVPGWPTRLAMLTSIVMLGYIIQGIWLKDLVFVLLGLFITGAVLACHAWLKPPYFLLGLGLLGGGALLLGGLAIHLRKG